MSLTKTLHREVPEQMNALVDPGDLEEMIARTASQFDRFISAEHVSINEIDHGPNEDWADVAGKASITAFPFNHVYQFGVYHGRKSNSASFGELEVVLEID